MEQTANRVSLLNKNLNDLTVGDALKINLTIAAAAVVVPVALGCTIAVKDAVKARVRQRKTNKSEVHIPEED